jgi:hypothetical protein
MWYIVIFVLAAVGLIFSYTGLTSCNSILPNSCDTIPDSIKGSYSKEEVKTMLEELAEKPVKKELNMGAMCYSPRPMPDSATYICPVCGEKTIYTSGNAEFVLESIPQCRRSAGRFKKDHIKLDESQFCRKCSPEAIVNPQLCLVVELVNQAPVKTCKVYPWDLEMLVAFFEGRTYYKADNDAEIALKDNLPRIKELLGMKND